MSLALFVALIAGGLDGEVTLTAAFEPAAAEIGQPVTCTLSVLHPAGETVRVSEDLGLDDSWLPLREMRVVKQAGAQAGSVRTTATWVLCSLESGQRELELPPVRFRAGGVLHVERAAPALLSVVPALQEGEDEPRTWAGFRQPPAERGLAAVRGRLLAGLGAALVAAVLGVAFLASRSRRAVIAAPPTAAERLAALRAGADDPQRARALHYELSQLLRDAVDTLQGQDRRGATDPEWLALARERGGLPSEALTRLRALFDSNARVKYAQEQPTKWALEQSLDECAQLLELLAPAPARGEARS